MTKIVLATALLVTLLPSAARAGDHGTKSSPQPQGWVHLITKYCCDDYIRKCEPTPPVSKQKGGCRFLCDDYVRKCEPCPPVQKGKSVLGFLCDDYCRKCLPILRCSESQYLKCAPSTKSCPSTKSAK